MKTIGFLTATAFSSFLFVANTANAESAMEKTGVDSVLGIAPTAADVLSEMHQFDLFEQGADETAQQRGDEGLKQFSTDHAGAAEKQDKHLAALAKKAGVNVEFPEEPSAGRSNRLAGLQGSVGPAFVRNYYEAQVAEHDSVLSVLRRYLEKPDNDEVKTFASKQIPALEASQKALSETAKRTAQ
jgi:putative membrane protein